VIGIASTIAVSNNNSNDINNDGGG